MAHPSTSRRPRRRQMSEINVVPYIDVMLVLLVIFMVTAPLLAQGVNVNLPQASAEPLDPSQGEPIVVTIDPDGRYHFGVGSAQAEQVDPETLLARVVAARKLDANVPVLVKGDKDVFYGEVVRAMVLLQQAGVADVGLMTRSPDDDTRGG